MFYVILVPLMIWIISSLYEVINFIFPYLSFFAFNFTDSFLDSYPSILLVIMMSVPIVENINIFTHLLMIHFFFKFLRMLPIVKIAYRAFSSRYDPWIFLKFFHTLYNHLFLKAIFKLEFFNNTKFNFLVYYTIFNFELIDYLRSCSFG